MFLFERLISQVCVCVIDNQMNSISGFAFECCCCCCFELLPCEIVERTRECLVANQLCCIYGRCVLEGQDGEGGFVHGHVTIKTH